MSVNSKLRGPGQAVPTAPALEKGLDLLEVLAGEPSGLTQKAIAERIGRSVGEIFRMLAVLEQRGYVIRDAQSGRYRLTLQLFDLAYRHPPTRLLLQAATREMEPLANAIGQSCHLVGLHGNRLIVLAQSQPDQQLMGWSVRVGAGFPLSAIYASGRVLSAFQRNERRVDLVKQICVHDGTSPTDLVRDLDRIAQDGFELASSQVAQGVTDISLPVLDHFGAAVAALTIAVMSRPGSDLTPSALLDPIRDAARAVSRAIGGQVI